MNKLVRGMAALALLLSLALASGRAEDDKPGTVENPKYKFWANFKPGATSTYREKTKFSGPEKASLPGGVSEKTVVYKLANVNKDKAVVTTTVHEEDFLGTVESAPTRHHYPAKVNKSHLEAVLEEWGVKEGEDETVKVGGKEIKCKVRAGTHKTEGGSVEFKLLTSDAVPGGVVKRTRVTKAGDKVVAETTITLVSFAEPKVQPKKDKDKKDKAEKEKGEKKE